MLNALGRREAALSATKTPSRSAVELAAARPDAFKIPTWQASLNNLGHQVINALGRH